MRNRWSHYPALVAILIALGSGSAAATTVHQKKSRHAAKAVEADLLRRVEELEREVERLKHELSAAPEPDSTRSLAQKLGSLQHSVENHQRERNEASVRNSYALGPEGFSLVSSDSESQLRIRGYIQADDRFFTTGNKPGSGSTFVLRRVRPVFEGTVFKYVDFKVMPDFGQGASVLEDGYIDVNYFPFARLQAGKFKGSFDFERLQSARDLTFIERGQTINLVPDREVGVNLHGLMLDRRLDYALGLYNGTPDRSVTTDIDSNDSKDFIGRLFANPFARSGLPAAEGLGLGIAGSFGDERGALPAYRSFGQNGFFSYAKGVTASGARARWEPQLYYHWGPFATLAEFVQNTQRVAMVNRQGTTLRAALSNQAWQIASSLVLTGEQASFEGVRPGIRFDPHGRWGAFEVAARYSVIGIDRQTFSRGFASDSSSAREAHEWVVGLNWYLNYNLKLQTDYARTQFVLGAAGRRNQRDESTISQRLQIAF